MTTDPINPSNVSEPSSRSSALLRDLLFALERLLGFAWILSPGLACVIGMDLVRTAAGGGALGGDLGWRLLVEIVLVVVVVLHFKDSWGAWWAYTAGKGDRMGSDWSYTQGDLDAARAKLDDAIEKLDQAIRLNPQYTDAYIQRGIAYERKGDLDRALIDLSKAIQAQPNRAGCYKTRGICFYKKRDLDHAIEDLDVAIRLYPHCRTYFVRGVMSFEQGDLDRAIDDYDMALQQGRHTTNAVPFKALSDRYILVAYVGGVSYNRGLAYLGKGDLPRAIIDFSAAILSDRDFGEAYYGRALAFHYEGEYDKALHDSIKLLELDPENVHALDLRARIYKEFGRPEEAIADFNRIVQLGTDTDLSQVAAEELRELKLPSLASVDEVLSRKRLLELSQLCAQRWVHGPRTGGLAWDLRHMMEPQQPSVPRPTGAGGLL